MLKFTAVAIATAFVSWTIHKIQSGPITPRRIMGPVCAAVTAYLAVYGWTQGGWKQGLEMGFAGFIGGTVLSILMGTTAMLLGRFFWRVYPVFSNSTDLLLPDLDHDEKLLHSSDATFLDGGRNLGGQLTLTSRRLVLRPFSWHIDVPLLEIPLAEITSTAACPTLFSIPTGLLVVLATGEEYRFVVLGRDEWLSDIQSQCATIKSPAVNS